VQGTTTTQLIINLTLQVLLHNIVFILFYHLHSLFYLVLRAAIDAALITKKPSPYVEVVVDGKSVRKTEVVKNTYEPTWSNETFTV
jgi:hypothetical protein